MAVRKRWFTSRRALRLSEADRCKAIQLVSSGTASHAASHANIVQSNDCGKATGSALV